MATFLGNTITIDVPDVTTVLADGFDSVRLYRATTRTGTYSVITTITLVAGTTAYTYEHTTGATTDWYYWTYYSTGSSNESASSEPFPAGGAPVIDRLTLVRLAADRLRCIVRPLGDGDFPGPTGTTTAAGTTTVVVCSGFADSLAASDGAAATGRYRGYWLVPRGGTESGAARRVSTLTTANGAFTVSRAFSNSIVNGIPFDVYTPHLTPAEWSDMVEAARRDVWFPTTLQITGVAGQREYPLPYWIEREDQVRDLAIRYGDTPLQQRYTKGLVFELYPRPGGGVYLYVSRGLSPNLVYQLTGERKLPPFADDDATQPCAEPFQYLLAVTAAMRAAQRITDEPGLTRENRDRWRERLVALEEERQGIVRDLGTFQAQKNPRRDAMVPVAGEGAPVPPSYYTSIYY